MSIRIWVWAVLLAAPVACAPDQTAHVTSGQPDDPMVSVLRDNMSETDVTALVHIDSVQVIEEEGQVTIRFTARVLQTLSGTLPETIQFSQFAEPGDAEAPGGDRDAIVSLCRAGDGEYYLPDVGYDVPFDERLVSSTVRNSTLEGADYKNRAASVCR